MLKSRSTFTMICQQLTSQLMPLFACILILCSVYCVSSDGGDHDDRFHLKLVTVIIRDGQHTPSFHYSYIDPYLRKEFWPDGENELVANGKKQLYHLGQALRTRYHNFLTDSPREVIARSADDDKCIESALMILHGTYKATGRWKYDDDTDFLPIPVHTAPKKYDCMLSAECDCPQTVQAINSLVSSAEVAGLTHRYQGTFKLLQAKTSLTNLWDQIAYAETVQLQVQLGSKIPSWITPGVIEEFNEIATAFHTMGTIYPDLLKLMVGNIYAELKGQLLNATGNTTSSSTKPRLLLYSTTNPLFSSITYGLGEITGFIPPPGSALVLELLESWKPVKYFVRLYFWNETHPDQQPIKLSPSYFDQTTGQCLLDELLHHMEPFIPQDWRATCGLPVNAANTGLDTLSVVLIIILIVIFSSVAFVIFMIVKRSRSGYLLLK